LRREWIPSPEESKYRNEEGEESKDMAQPARVTKENVLNGVDVDKLTSTIDAIRKNNELANFQFRARNQWVEGGHSRTTVTDFDGTSQTHRHSKPFTLDSDEPPVLLGGDRAANPVVYLLHGLASCMATAIAYHAAARGIRVEQIESQLEGDIDLRGFLGLDEKVRPGYKQIRVKLRVKADCPEDKLKEVMQFGSKYSPVYNVITSNIPVEVEMIH
jgi:uncharacterized OsmC-like protein